MHPLIVAEYDRMGETMGRIIWRLSPFIILIAGLILGALVLFWSKSIGIWSFQIPADACCGISDKEVGFEDLMSGNL